VSSLVSRGIELPSHDMVEDSARKLSPEDALPGSWIAKRVIDATGLPLPDEPGNG